MSQEKVPIAEAAERLGLSLSAARKRVQRGTLTAEKDDSGQWLVLFDTTETDRETLGTTPETEPVTAATSAETDPKTPETGAESRFATQLIETLREQNQRLWLELENRDRELETRADELRRKDILLAELTHQLRALPAPASNGHQPEPTVETPKVVATASPRPWWKFWAVD